MKEEHRAFELNVELVERNISGALRALSVTAPFYHQDFIHNGNDTPVWNNINILTHHTGRDAVLCLARIWLPDDKAKNLHKAKNILPKLKSLICSDPRYSQKLWEQGSFIKEGHFLYDDYVSVERNHPPKITWDRVLPRIITRFNDIYTEENTYNITKLAGFRNKFLAHSDGSPLTDSERISLLECEVLMKDTFELLEAIQLVSGRNRNDYTYLWSYFRNEALAGYAQIFQRK